MVSHIKWTDQNEWEIYGATEFEAFYKAVCNLMQVKDLCVKEPDPHLFGHDSNIVYQKYKHALQDLLKGSTCNSNLGQIFVEESRNNLKGQVLKIECKKNQVFSLDQAFSLMLDCGETKTAYIHKWRFCNFSILHK